MVLPSAGDMASRTRRNQKVTWRSLESDAESDASGSVAPDATDASIWVSWMEVGGSRRDDTGLLSVPGTRVVSYAAWSDPVGMNDLLIRNGRGYRVEGVVELENQLGRRLELELDINADLS